MNWRRDLDSIGADAPMPERIDPRVRQALLVYREVVASAHEALLVELESLGVPSGPAIDPKAVQLDTLAATWGSAVESQLSGHR